MNDFEGFSENACGVHPFLLQSNHSNKIKGGYHEEQK